MDNHWIDHDWTRHIVIALVSAVTVFALAVWAQKPVEDRHGWRPIRPGAIYRVGIGLGMAVTMLMAWVLLFVGSSRPDGAQQMQILFWLIVAFGAGTLFTLFQFVRVRRMAMRWRGETLVWRGAGGTEISRKLSAAVAVRTSIGGWVVIAFADGTKARIDPYSSNAEALIDTVRQHL